MVIQRCKVVSDLAFVEKNFQMQFGLLLGVTDFIQSCLRTDFMSQHSRKPEFWHDFADAIEERLAELINTVRCHYSLEANKVAMGNLTILKRFVFAPVLHNKQKVEAFVDKP